MKIKKYVRLDNGLIKFVDDFKMFERDGRKLYLNYVEDVNGELVQRKNRIVETADKLSTLTNSIKYLLLCNLYHKINTDNWIKNKPYGKYNVDYEMLADNTLLTLKEISYEEKQWNFIPERFNYALGTKKKTFVLLFEKLEDIDPTVFKKLEWEVIE